MQMKEVSRKLCAKKTKAYESSLARRGRSREATMVSTLENEKRQGGSQHVLIISLILGKPHIEAAHISEVQFVLRSQEQAAWRARSVRRRAGSR